MKTSRDAAFDDTQGQLANDSQPGASSGGSSSYLCSGDAMLLKEMIALKGRTLMPYVGSCERAATRRPLQRPRPPRACHHLNEEGRSVARTAKLWGRTDAHEP